MDVIKKALAVISITWAGDDVEKANYTLSGNVNYCSHCRKQNEEISKY